MYNFDIYYFNLGFCVDCRVKVAIIRPAVKFGSRGYQSTSTGWHATYHERRSGITFAFSSSTARIYSNLLLRTQNLHTEALSLRAKMSEVQSDITQVQRETGECMEHLERLDLLKTKLQVGIVQKGSITN